jgi:hypothetical protein
VQVLNQLLGLIGLNVDRLLLDWVSAGEGERFATLVRQFTERATALGPVGQSEGLTSGELQERLAAARRVVEGERVRWLVGRKRELLEKGNVYGDKVDRGALDAAIESSVADEYLRSRLLLLTADRALSVKEMGNVMGISPRLVLPHVMALEQDGLMTMVGIEGRSPKYRQG